MTTDATQFVTPTFQRLRQARPSNIEAPVVNQRSVRRGWRIMSVVETMRNTGKLSDERWEAWQRFERAWASAGISGRVVQQYGERFGGGGTPESQLTADAFWAEDVRQAGRLDKVDGVLAALRAVQVPRLQLALVMAASMDVDLEIIGRAIGRYTDTGKARATGANALEDGLWLLHTHYQHLYGQSSKVP